MSDWIQETIAARAETLGLSAYAIAKQVREADPSCTLSSETAKRFLDGKCALNSGYVSRIAAVLGLEFRVRKRR